MATVGDRINDACGQNGLTLAAACAQADVNYKTLHAQIRNDRAIPFETIDALAQSFSLPIDYFSAYRSKLGVHPGSDSNLLHQRAAAAYTAALRSEQIEMLKTGFDIGTDEVLNWLGAQNGRLTNFDALRERVDLFHEVGTEDTMMRPHRIGKQSLAKKFFRLDDEDHYVKVVGGFDRNIINEVILAHLQASRLKYSITDLDIDVRIGSHRVVQSYRRIIAPVRDMNGRKFMLVHAKLI